MKNKFFNTILLTVMLSVLFTAASISFVLAVDGGDICEKVLPVTFTIMVVLIGIFLGLLRYFRRKSAELLGENSEEDMRHEERSFSSREVEERERLWREMYANVSHEMKTPLTTIQGYAEMMAKGMIPSEDVAEIASKMWEESNRLLAMIERAMESMSHTEKSVTAKHELVDLNQIARDVTERLSPFAEKKQIDLRLVGDSAMLWSDPDMLEQICYNLVDNAIKYTYDGGSVDVFVKNLPEEQCKCLIVADTGIGISSEDQKRIFERFFRAERSHSRSIDGVGLGLSIVKHHADVLGGRLVVKSSPGKGTEMECIFPNLNNGMK